MQVCLHELVVGQVGVLAVDPLDLIGLAGREALVRVEAPRPLEQALPAQDLVHARDDAGEAVGGDPNGSRQSL